MGRDRLPVPVDVDPDTLELDQAMLPRAVTPRTKALIVTHLFGARIDIDGAVAWAHERKLLLFEDCAQHRADCRPPRLDPPVGGPLLARQVRISTTLPRAPQPRVVSIRSLPSIESPMLLDERAKTCAVFCRFGLRWCGR